MNSATESSTFVDDEVAAGIELLEAAGEGRGDDAVRILQADPDLIRTADMAGDTVLHVVAREGHVETMRQLLRFLQKHSKLKWMVIDEGNVDEDTALHVAIKSGHVEAALELVRAERGVVWSKNKEGLSPMDLAEKGGYKELLEYMRSPSTSSEEENYPLTKDAKEDENDYDSLLEVNDGMSKLNNDLHKDDEKNDLSAKYDDLSMKYEKVLNNIQDTYEGEISMAMDKSSFADMEMEQILGDVLSFDEKEILQILAADPTLVRRRGQAGATAIHLAAKVGHVEMMKKLLGTMTNEELSRLVLEGDKDGNTALHLAMDYGWAHQGKKKKGMVQYIATVGPEAAYRVNNEGSSPLYMGVLCRYEDVIRYVFKVMPGHKVSDSIKDSLLKTKKASIVHAAVKARNLGMLQVVMENLPNLIDALDEKGWRPLSYAAYRGYFDEVSYFLEKFPDSVKKFDSDGSLPMHKAVCGGHVKVVKEFTSKSPETVYNIDKKGRSILHIAVRYCKDDILFYLKENVDIQRLSNLRDLEGKTYIDYLAKKLKQ